MAIGQQFICDYQLWQIAKSEPQSATTRKPHEDLYNNLSAEISFYGIRLGDPARWFETQLWVCTHSTYLLLLLLAWSWCTALAIPLTIWQIHFSFGEFDMPTESGL